MLLPFTDSLVVTTHFDAECAMLADRLPRECTSHATLGCDDESLERRVRRLENKEKEIIDALQEASQRMLAPR